jgi:uncharacterized protein HemX
MGNLIAAIAVAVVLAAGVGYYSHSQTNDLNAKIAGLESRIAAMESSVTAQSQAEKATLDKMSKEIADSTAAAQGAATAATQAADAAKDAQKSADRTSITGSRVTASGLRNK